MQVKGRLGGVVTLEQLGNIGELMGGIAVVASLHYVGVQLRQNTKITKASVRQSIAARASEAAGASDGR